MELMRSAFLCVLVALVPQTLGIFRSKTNEGDLKYNSTMLLQQNARIRKTILLNINGPPLVNNHSDFQIVYNDVACSSCKKCMDRAIKAHSNHVYMSNNRPNIQELHDDVLTNEVIQRTKRSAQSVSDTTVEYTTKKIKSKKHKSPKTVSVTKYSGDDVYALKVKETQTSPSENKTITTCQVYKVKKSYSCDSSEADALLTALKRKSRRKNRNVHSKKTPESTTTVKTHTSLFKREVDDSQVPENVMPSSEDIY